MSCSEEKYILGDWKFSDRKGTLSIEKVGETYKCAWKIDKENTCYEYLGIGMFVDDNLIVSRYQKEVAVAGIGMYMQIGDLRSNSALWASTQNFDTLGSGIALRNETSESFEGNYKVRYFIKEYESPTFDLKIIKKEQGNNLYELNWAVNNQVQLHGIGTIHDRQMFLAYGGVNFEYELVVLSIHNQGTLNGKSAPIRSCSVNEEIYIR
ncbi:hypothetical protein [Clostridium saccharobutylicum]|uniref:Uncharacterized protein n=1 Tax=Clostridium saccharobutylicum TaxID=169679 RepID=A0A1S8NCU4_CLOSA|nr:hypothetical protein [Clostridium saccharobutylicum]OOM14208.1 hypothetical protein CLOSAC_10810 [Clostridium saccharobutylicum]